MTTLYEGAFAKVNLTLDVLGKREDGYHDIKSIMQGISIRDDIEIDVGTGKPWKLLCSVEGIPTDERNLAYKAAKLFIEKYDMDVIEDMLNSYYAKQKNNNLTQQTAQQLGVNMIFLI